jgi:PAS domain S-box-containing protein
MVAGLLVTTAIAAVDIAVGNDVVLLTALLAGPVFAAVGARPGQTAFVGCYALALTLPCAAADGLWGTHDQLVRTSIVALVSIAAVLFAKLRQLRDEELARTRPEAVIAQHLRLALAAGEMGTWRWDLKRGRLEWDAQLERLFGLQTGEFDGSFDTYISLIHPDDRAVSMAAVQEGMQRGEAWSFDHRVVWRDGSVHWIEGSGEPVRDGRGSVIGAAGVSTNIDARRSLLDAERTAREAAEHSTVVLTHLSEVTTALAVATTIDEVGNVIVNAGVRALRARSGYFATVDGLTEELVMRAQFGYPGWIVRRYARVPLDADVPGSEAARTGTPIVIESAEDRSKRFPHHRDDPMHPAFVTVPVMSGDQATAVIAFGFGEPRRFDDDDRRYIAAVIDACTQALRRASAFEAEQAAQSRLRALLDASEQLADVDDPDRVVDTIAHIAATLIGKWASVMLFDRSGELRRRGTAHADPSLTPVVAALLERDFDGGAAVRKVAATGEPAVFYGLIDEAREAAAVDPELARMIETLHYASCIVVPISVVGRTLGTLTIGDDRPEGLRGADIELAVDLGRRGASALERTLLTQAEQARAATALRQSEARAEAEHRLVELLQRTIFPDRLPELPGVELAAEYRPAEVLVDVGGDWYDAFVAPDGRLVLVVGDVAGHGIGAASLMGRVRNALRAYAVETTDAASILHRLHNLLRTLDEFSMVTAFVACYDPATRTMSWSRAGHPPPLLVTSDGRARFLDDVNGAPLGTMVRAYATSVVTLEPDSLLVGYTDGLVERRDRVLDDGLAWLASRVTDLVDRPLDEMCGRLLDDPFVPHPSPDDVCILALRHRGG